MQSRNCRRGGSAIPTFSGFRLGVWRSVLRRMMAKARMKAVSVVLEWSLATRSGLHWQYRWLNTSIRRSIFCASPGMRKYVWNLRRAAWKEEWKIGREGGRKVRRNYAKYSHNKYICSFLVSFGRVKTAEHIYSSNKCS